MNMFVCLSTSQTNEHWPLIGRTNEHDLTNTVCLFIGHPAFALTDHKAVRFALLSIPESVEAILLTVDKIRDGINCKPAKQNVNVDVAILGNLSVGFIEKVAAEPVPERLAFWRCDIWCCIDWRDELPPLRVQIRIDRGDNIRLVELDHSQTTGLLVKLHSRKDRAQCVRTTN